MSSITDISDKRKAKQRYGGLLLFTLITGATVYVAFNLVNPSMTIPRVTVPKPNAYDVYTGAGAKIVRTNDLKDVFRQKPAKQWSLREKRRLLEDNRSALDAYDAALPLAYRQPLPEDGLAKYPEYESFRRYADLKRLESEIHQEQGKYGEAMRSAIEGIQFGAKVSQGAPLVGALLSMSCQQNCRKPLWDLVKHLQADEAREGARRLEEATTLQAPFSSSLEVEKWGIQQTFLEVMHRARPFSIAHLQFALLGKRRIMADMTRYIDAARDTAVRPYNPPIVEPPEPSDVLSQIMIPVYLPGIVKSHVNAAQQALLATSLALQAYRMEQGRYPKSLDDLVPRYMTRLPVDPFSPSGGPLLYKDEKNAIVYSVGPDAKDDGGRPIYTAIEKDEKRRTIRSESVGDIVAGLNRN